MEISIWDLKADFLVINFDWAYLTKPDFEILTIDPAPDCLQQLIPKVVVLHVQVTIYC